MPAAIVEVAVVAVVMVVLVAAMAIEMVGMVMLAMPSTALCFDDSVTPFCTPNTSPSGTAVLPQYTRSSARGQ